MKRKDDNMTHSVNDDLLDDLDDDNEDSILVIFDDLVDLEIEKGWILIWEICSDDFLDEDSDDDERKCVNEKISKRLSKLVLKIHICDVKRKLVILE
jgi:hypothetical protein